ncbi:hypothetical protein GPB2148_1400 [marine gamma proteobacterium HTCC2148]|nr:hypothetical protein GPB2148_1400 [marine gamma proteobacterium HTCC2148]
MFAVFYKDPNGKSRVEFHVDTGPGLLVEFSLAETRIIDHGDQAGIEFSSDNFSVTLHVSGPAKRKFTQFLATECNCTPK